MFKADKKDAPGQLEPLETDRDVEGITYAMRKRLEPLSISYEELNSWEDINIMKLEKNRQTGITGWILMQNTQMCGDVELLPDITATFLQTLLQGYRLDNPFHNWTHAVDVHHHIWRMLMLSKAHAYLSGLEQFSLLVSAIGHDVGHLGVNNQFLVETAHELAVRYNDRSPLENMHCATFFGIVTSTKGANIFEAIPRKDYFELRRICIASILHTDNVLHFEIVKETQMLYQLNTDAWEPETPASPANGSFDVFDRLP